jgi:hypothetical protein
MVKHYELLCKSLTTVEQNPLKNLNYVLLVNKASGGHEYTSNIQTTCIETTFATLIPAPTIQTYLDLMAIL